MCESACVSSFDTNRVSCAVPRQPARYTLFAPVHSSLFSMKSMHPPPMSAACCAAPGVLRSANNMHRFVSSTVKSALSTRRTCACVCVCVCVCVRACVCQDDKPAKSTRRICAHTHTHTHTKTRHNALANTPAWTARGGGSGMRDWGLESRPKPEHTRVVSRGEKFGSGD